MNLSKENMQRIGDLVAAGCALSYEDIKDLHGHNEHLTLLLEARFRLMLGLENERDQLQTENNEFRRRAGSMNLGGFGDAFYKVAESLGITGARPDSPMQVFASEIYPALEEAIKNAARYEWLRNGASVILNKEVGFTAESGAKIYSTMPSQRELDSAIDAAMSQGEIP